MQQTANIPHSKEDLREAMIRDQAELKHPKSDTNSPVVEKTDYILVPFVCRLWGSKTFYESVTAFVVPINKAQAQQKV